MAENNLMGCIFHSDCIHCTQRNDFGHISSECDLHGLLDNMDNPYYSIKAEDCPDFETYDWMKDVIKNRKECFNDM